jgi:hypothetical protein
VLFSFCHVSAGVLPTISSGEHADGFGMISGGALTELHVCNSYGKLLDPRLQQLGEWAAVLTVRLCVTPTPTAAPLHASTALAPTLLGRGHDTPEAMRDAVEPTATAAGCTAAVQQTIS